MHFNAITLYKVIITLSRAAKNFSSDAKLIENYPKLVRRYWKYCWKTKACIVHRNCSWDGEEGKENALNKSTLCCCQYKLSTAKMGGVVERANQQFLNFSAPLDETRSFGHNHKK